MAKFDGVIEAVRYKGGRIDVVRVYERRGAAFSDHVLLDRAALLARLKQGRRFVTGRRNRPAVTAYNDPAGQVAAPGPHPKAQSRARREWIGPCFIIPSASRVSLLERSSAA